MEISKFLSISFENHPTLGRTLKLIVNEQYRFDEETGEFKVSKPVDVKLVKNFGQDERGNDRTVYQYELRLSVDSMAKLGELFSKINESPEVYFGEFTEQVEHDEV